MIAMNIGFIGFGSMARMIIRGLIEYAKVDPGSIYVTRKNKDRLSEINSIFKDIHVVNTCREIMENAQMVFLCAKPAEIRDILLEIAPYMTGDTRIVSIAGSVSIANIQSVIKGKITKYIPTITSETGWGVSLVCHNDQISGEDAACFDGLISHFSKVRYVKEEDFSLATELTSCMPGFIASIFDNLTSSALRHTTSFDINTINSLVLDTLFATAKLLVESGMSFDEVVERVATKGGITREGVTVFDAALPRVFDMMFDATLEKRRITEEIINKDYHSV